MPVISFTFIYLLFIILGAGGLAKKYNISSGDDNDNDNNSSSSGINFMYKHKEDKKTLTIFNFRDY